LVHSLLVSSKKHAYCVSDEVAKQNVPTMLALASSSVESCSFLVGSKYVVWHSSKKPIIG